MIDELIKLGFNPTVIAGRTPTFPFYKRIENLEFSPGTFVFWDKGYVQIFKERDFLPATLILTRVISNPIPGLYCLL